MSDTDNSDRADDLEEIRRRKRKRLQERAETPDSPSEPIDVGGIGHFEELLEEYPIVLVDFYADWCGPCKMLEPVVERLAEETVATVAKVDVDANQQLASSYNVRGVPTLVFFAEGDQVEEIVGVEPEDQLRSRIEQYS